MNLLDMHLYKVSSRMNPMHRKAVFASHRRYDRYAFKALVIEACVVAAETIADEHPGALIRDYSVLHDRAMRVLGRNFKLRRVAINEENENWKILHDIVIDDTHPFSVYEFAHIAGDATPTQCMIAHALKARGIPNIGRVDL